METENNKNEKSISDKVLEKIQEKNIAIKPKWRFLLEDYVIWIFSIVCLLIGSVAFSVVLYLTINSDWALYKEIDDSLAEFLLLSLPYLWIILVILFVFAADYNFKHTKNGYKYNLKYIVFFGILLSILLGFFMFCLGAGKAIDNVLSDNVPAYNKFIDKRPKLWAHPEKGILAGDILEVNPDKTLKLRDFFGKEYIVDYNNAVLIPDIPLKPGFKIRAIGEQKGDLFFAQRIAPLRPINKRILPPPPQTRGILRHPLNPLM